ncbi:MAG: GerW family sporulation protein [Clostridia bacterium]|nr:GerW family sporulation protein [Clostridia bacterium]MBQ2274214.1 GerW family sporulation protein [Clostridia bacterium]MBQ5798523.1 GerW family sporulation protein [Clostridia bacterium]MBQ5900717.1 GerW family sporulation protein [Clostridia bacterium]MEE1278825.1 GerW family sporulation protein [Acutalibacteraceae bacterium]
MSENNIKAIIDVTMEKLRAMVDSDTVLGTPVTVGDTAVIPVSKVAFGLATGGSDFPSKTDKQVFGGGGGAGVSINPMGVLVISGGNVKFVPINNEITSIDRLLQAAPEILDKIKGMTGKHEPTVY